MNEQEGAATVRRGAMRLARRLRMERPAGSLNGTKLSVLADLHRSGGMTPTEIAAAEHVKAQSMTRVLADLEGEGLVARHRDPSDGRQWVVTLTPAGRDALVEDMAHRDAWLAAAIDGHLSPAERHLLYMAGELMERLAEAGRSPVSDTTLPGR
ncbi:MarR family transcriptional regulator [Planotetraspora thailandica]|uniref:MarR family transcriptional regulator n=1 Tax=Planotetraspora thailandica TaxID=487172 RepID=A0A8J3UZJ0_9ACTN|nr:MarR family transcriptional regulator [Planotetraspora thailandica]GII53500.1 MarR family transcriptional regulator [Planotetraspora thailandica]